MDSVIEKFLLFLNGKCDLIMNDIVSRALRKGATNYLPEDEYLINEVSEMKRVVRLLSVPKSDWNKYVEVYIDFNLLEEMLKSSHLKLRDQIHVIMAMFEKNIATGVLEHELNGFNAPAIEEYSFKTMSKEEARDMIHSQKYRTMISKDEKELTDLQKAQLDEILEFIDSNPLDISHVVEKHRMLSGAYFEKRDTFNYNDVNTIIEILKSFGISEEMALNIKNFFDKEVQKRESRQVVRQIKIVVPESKKSQVDVGLATREVKKHYHLLNQELGKYFDMKTMEPVRSLNIDEQIYCVGIMLKIGITEIEIKKVLKAMNKDNELFSKEVNPIVLYSRLYERMTYYGVDNPLLAESIKQLYFYYQETMICNDDDYVFWKSAIGEEMEKVQGMIPNTYEYEINKAKGF